MKSTNFPINSTHSLCLHLIVISVISIGGQPKAVGSSGVWQKSEIANEYSRSASIDPADLDGDGRVDILSCSRMKDRISWYRNIGGTSLFAPQQILVDAAGAPKYVCAADLDGDYDLDVLVILEDRNEIVWYENVNGSGEVELRQVMVDEANDASSAHVADVDGDGDPDVLCSGTNLVWYENLDGRGAFGAPQTIATGGATPVQTGDLDGDGDLDVLSTWRHEQVFFLYPPCKDCDASWFENADGKGTFWREHIFLTPDHFSQSVYPADLDGDGDCDLVSASARTNVVSWFENVDSLGTFVFSSAIGYGESIDVVDLDCDGDLDVLCGSSANAKLVWHENEDGRGTFGPEHVIGTDKYQVVVRTADLDGDGDQEALSVYNSWGGGAIAWYGNEYDLDRPKIIAHPEAMDFGHVELGASADWNFVLKNARRMTVSGTASVPEGPFTIIDGQSFNLAFGETHQVTVRYAPTGLGDHAAQVSLSGGIGDSLELRGSAYDASCKLTYGVFERAVDWGASASPPMQGRMEDSRQSPCRWSRPVGHIRSCRERRRHW